MEILADINNSLVSLLGFCLITGIMRQFVPNDFKKIIYPVFELIIISLASIPLIREIKDFSPEEYLKSPYALTSDFYELQESFIERETEQYIKEKFLSLGIIPEEVLIDINVDAEGGTNFESCTVILSDKSEAKFAEVKDELQKELGIIINSEGVNDGAA